MSYSHYFILSVLIVNLFSGCGGSGSPSNLPDSTGNGGPGFQTSIFVETRPIPTPAAADAVIRAVPTAGSVTQGSNVNAGVTTDRVSIRFIPDGQDIESIPYHPIATIHTDDGRTLESNNDPNRMQVHLPSGEITYLVREEGFFREEVGPIYYPQYVTTISSPIYSPGDVPDVSPYGMHSGEEPTNYQEPTNYLEHPKEGRRIDEFWVVDILDGGSFAKNEDGSIRVIGNPRGMSVSGFTDYPSSQQGTNPDTDYVSWGSWIYYQVNTPSNADFSFGAFADGIETTFSAVPLNGTASYAGYSTGHAVKENFQEININDDTTPSLMFVANVNLTANFTEGSAVVTGTVDNFKGSDLSATSPAIIAEALADDGFFADLTIALGRANITEKSSHSFFQGDARATGLSGATGKWGGQFFGTPGAGEAPPAVGGTWGVTQGTGPNDWKMIGGYGAWKNP